MSDGAKTDPKSIQGGPPQAAESIRNWLDVAAKLIGAVAIAGVTYVGYNYQSKASTSSVINQREQAESQLRASMLGDLVEPLTGKNGAASEVADPARQRLLAEMVTLNFHDHFEFKPLLQEVDARLMAAHDEDGRGKIAEVARRVVDRQINMLTAIDGVSSGGGPNGYRAEVTTIDLMTPMGSKDSYPTSSNNCTENYVRLKKPFGIAERSSICASSPDNKICLFLRFFSPEDYKKSIVMGGTVIFQNSSRHPRSLIWPLAVFAAADRPADCTPNMEKDSPLDSIQQIDEAHLSIFDFPLTDNSKIVWKGKEYRFSISIHRMTSRLIKLKLVWFPQGYVTERERPINQVEFAKFLGSR